VDATGCRQLHFQLLAGDLLDSRRHRPGALLKLQLAVFDLVAARGRLFTLELTNSWRA